MEAYRAENGMMSEEAVDAVEREIRRKKRRKRTAKRLTAAALILAALCIYASVRLSRIVVDIGLSNVSDLVTSVVSDTIAMRMADGALDYEDLVLLEKDKDGNITALLTNMAKINMLQSEITNSVIASLYDDAYMNISVPLGNILGGSILSGRGPSVPVRIISASTVGTEFVNEFSDAGVNQTRHQIKLNVTVNMSVLLPGKSEDFTVTTQVPVAETLIIGKVPETYAELYGSAE